MVEKAKLASVRQVALIANHLKTEQQKRFRASRDLPAMYAAVVGAKARQMKALLEGIELDRERLLAVEAAALAAKDKWQQLDSENDEIVRVGLELDTWFKEFDADAIALKDYLPDMEAARRQNLGEEIDKLTASLVTVSDPVEIKARLDSKRKR